MYSKARNKKKMFWSNRNEHAHRLAWYFYVIITNVWFGIHSSPVLSIVGDISIGIPTGAYFWKTISTTIEIKKTKVVWTSQATKCGLFFYTYQIHRHCPDVIQIWTSSETIGAHHRSKFSCQSSAALSSPYKWYFSGKQTNRLMFF